MNSVDHNDSIDNIIILRTSKNMEKRKIVVGGVYQHYRGDYYKVLSLALDNETLTQLVVYVALYYKPEKEDRVWVRPLEVFMGTKELEDGKVVNRYEFISER